MEKTNKVMRIILSVVTIVCVALFAVSFFALPVESINNGPQTVGLNIYDIIKSFFEAVKSISEQGGEYAIQHIGALFTLLITMAFALVFGIIALVKGIILLVKTIKGMSGKGELEPLLKSLVGFGTIIVVYIALLLGIIYANQPGTVTGLGAGTDMMLSVGITSLAVAGVYRIAVKDDRKLVNKIFGFAVSTVAIIGVILAFSASVTQNGGTHGILWLFPGFIQTISSTSTPDTSIVTAYVFGIIGVVVVIVSLGMAKSVIAYGFAVDVDGKKPDFAKSSIVKSAVWLGLMVIGFVLIAVALNKMNVGLGAGAIVGMVMAALALAGSIVNKVLSNKSAAPAKVEEEPAEAKAE